MSSTAQNVVDHLLISIDSKNLVHKLPIGAYQGLLFESSYVFAAFLLWTLVAYALHRVAHIRSPNNPLWWTHMAHHKNDYRDKKPAWPLFREYFLWFGSIPKTLDVWLVFILPLILITRFMGRKTWILLPLYWFYEVFLADGVLDHNRSITGNITRFLSIGSYHLRHHEKCNVNYSFFITLWDHVFGTFDKTYRVGDVYVKSADL